MKRSTLWACVVVGSFLAAACTDSDGTGIDDLSGPVTASVDGDAFVADFASVNRSGGQVSVNAAALPQRAIAFTFPDAGTGTYTIGGGSSVFVTYTEGTASWSAGSGLGSGSITVTTLAADRLVGTFQLTVVDAVGSDPRFITNGQFDIDY